MNHEQTNKFKARHRYGIYRRLDTMQLIKHWIPELKVFDEVRANHQITQKQICNTTENKSKLLGNQTEIDISEELKERRAALDYDRRTNVEEVSFFENCKTKIKLWPQVEEKLFSVPPSTLLNIDDPWDLNHIQRVYVIQYLLSERSRIQRQELEKCVADYEQNSKRRTELDNIHKANILRSKKVIGLTVTGASINRDILKQVNPEIIIVEEAAEILESHLIALLGNSVKHLILIGDHQQLKPQVQYDLKQDYSFNTSMMERLIRNELPYATLQMQNRMRPEFAELLKDIYPGLKSHPRVTQNEPPKCMEKSMFFWTHSSPEIPGRSYKNEGEASRAIYLALFFLSQGYCAGQITILAAYQKQVLLLRDKLKIAEKNYPQLFDKQFVPHTNTNSRQSVHDTNPNKLVIHTIDNFQGDENEIVIISLVRSNDENKIGFLSRLDRRCVAQSRAKCGMYFIGNHRVLRKNKNWNNMLEGMRRSGCLDFKITLQCPDHQTVTKKQATDANDIKPILKGFCKICYKIQKRTEQIARQEKLHAIEKELQEIKKLPHAKCRIPVYPNGADAASYYLVHDRVIKYIQPKHNWSPTITKIEKLLNTELQVKFTEVKLKLFDPVSSTQHLFHGTGSVAMEAIINKGFKLPATPGWYGAGIYLATDSSKSQCYSRKKGANQLLLCEVLLGKVLTLKTADPNMNLQTLKENHCDSVFAPRDTKHKGGVLNDEYVVFRPEQVLPRYVVHYI